MKANKKISFVFEPICSCHKSRIHKEYTYTDGTIEKNTSIKRNCNKTGKSRSSLCIYILHIYIQYTEANSKRQERGLKKINPISLGCCTYVNRWSYDILFTRLTHSIHLIIHKIHTFPMIPIESVKIS